MQEIWQCLNRACSEVTPVTAHDSETNGKRCVCGNLMRKREQPVVFSYLDFLRKDGLADPGEAARKERIP
jgi:hypothetical protein